MRFPVLRINDHHIRKFRTFDDFRVMAQKSFDVGDFARGAIILDSSGDKYEVEHVTKLRNSRNPLHWFRPSRAIVVDTHLGPAYPIKLEEAKQLISDLVIGRKWYSQGGQTEDQFREYIRDAKTFTELMNRISFYGTWQG
jgi:hypothetical protein